MLSVIDFENLDDIGGPDPILESVDITIRTNG